MNAFARHLAALTMTLAASALLIAGALAPAAIAQGKAPVAQSGRVVA